MEQWHSLTSWPDKQSDNQVLVACPAPSHQNTRVDTGQVLYLVLNQAFQSSRPEPMNCGTIICMVEKLDRRCKASRR